MTEKPKGRRIKAVAAPLPNSEARLRALEEQLAEERQMRRRLETELAASRALADSDLKEFSDLLMQALSGSEPHREFQNPHLAPEEHGVQDRCWLHDPACPRVPSLDDNFAERMQTCTNCDVFKKQAPDSYSRLGETINSVLFMLQRRHDQYQQAQEALIQTEKLAALGELAAGLAHEINTPTGIILSRIDVMSMDTENPLPPQVKEDLEVIRRHADRLRRITGSLTSFARRHKVEKRPVNLQDLLSELLEITERLVQKSAVSVRVTVPSEPMIVHADGTMVQQVFMNLIINARDAMPSGGRLEIAGYHEHGNCVLEFRDNGIGMDEDVRTRVFDPFFTTKEAKGTGLGLSLSYGIIKEHGGNIEVESSPGQGAKFRIALPAHRDKQSEVLG